MGSNVPPQELTRSEDTTVEEVMPRLIDGERLEDTINRAVKEIVEVRGDFSDIPQDRVKALIGAVLSHSASRKAGWTH